MDAGSIWQCAADIPEEWYEGDRASLERLVEEVLKRRVSIRKLISDYRQSSRDPFPLWRGRLRTAYRPVIDCDYSERIGSHNL